MKNTKGELVFGIEDLEMLDAAYLMSGSDSFRTKELLKEWFGKELDRKICTTISFPVLIKGIEKKEKEKQAFKVTNMILAKEPMNE
jgi:hypothetical protein